MCTVFVLACICLTKSRVMFSPPEKMVASYLHLIVLICEVFTKYFLKRQFMVLLFFMCFNNSFSVFSPMYIYRKTFWFQKKTSMMWPSQNFLLYNGTVIKIQVNEWINNLKKYVTSVTPPPPLWGNIQPVQIVTI